MSFEKTAAEGDVVGTLRLAVVTGSLWAIGSSWSMAIRQVVLFILPNDASDVVIGELLSASITTLLGVGVAIAAARHWGCCSRNFCNCRDGSDRANNGGAPRPTGRWHLRRSEGV